MSGTWAVLVWRQGQRRSPLSGTAKAVLVGCYGPVVGDGAWAEQAKADYDLRFLREGEWTTIEPLLDPELHVTSRLPSLGTPSPPSRGLRVPTGATVARGGLWETAATVIPQLYVVVQSIFIARYLGPTGVGQVAPTLGRLREISTSLAAGQTRTLAATIEARQRGRM